MCYMAILLIKNSDVLMRDHVNVSQDSRSSSVKSIKALASAPIWPRPKWHTSYALRVTYKTIGCPIFFVNYVSEYAADMRPHCVLLPSLRAPQQTSTCRSKWLYVTKVQKIARAEGSIWNMAFCVHTLLIHIVHIVN